MLLSGDEKTIQDLLQDQKFAVLSTYDSSQPYCNLVAFADINKGKSIIFITDRNTRKYRNLKKNEKVSLLIDNRTNRNIDFDEAIAVTLMGRAKEVQGENRGYCCQDEFSQPVSGTDYPLASDSLPETYRHIFCRNRNRQSIL